MLGKDLQDSALHMNLVSEVEIGIAVTTLLPKVISDVVVPL